MLSDCVNRMQFESIGRYVRMRVTASLGRGGGKAADQKDGEPQQAALYGASNHATPLLEAPTVWG